MLGFATTAMVFAVSSFLRGVARALGSGPAEAWYVDTVHATQGPVRGAAVGSVVMAVALLLLAGATLIAGAPGLGSALAYFALFVGLGIGSPAFATLTHARVESGQRATILSIQSLALQTAGVIGVNVLSRVSELTSPAVAFITVSVVIGTSTLALRAIRQTVTSYALRHEAHIHS